MLRLTSVVVHQSCSLRSIIPLARASCGRSAYLSCPRARQDRSSPITFGHALSFSLTPATRMQRSRLSIDVDVGRVYVPRCFCLPRKNTQRFPRGRLRRNDSTSPSSDRRLAFRMSASTRPWQQ